jgi:hypothetical protein
MNLFYMLAYKNCPIAYTLTKGEALTLTSCMPQSMTWQKIWANTPEDLCLPHVGDVPMRVWKVLSEIEFEKISKTP